MIKLCLYSIYYLFFLPDIYNNNILISNNKLIKYETLVQTYTIVFLWSLSTLLIFGSHPAYPRLAFESRLLLNFLHQFGDSVE